MDRAIEKKKMAPWQRLSLALAFTFFAGCAYYFLADASIRTYKVDADKIVVSSVIRGAFEDLIPIRGTIQPFDSVFLDAVDGGVVEEVFVEEGAFVTKGQALLQFSNTDLRLNVARNDTSITEQLNNLRNISNQLETTKLNTERQLIDIQYRVKQLIRKKGRMESLLSDDFVSKEQYENVTDELNYQNSILANTITRQELETKIRTNRLTQISTQINKLEENLKVAQSSFDNLLVRASISGQLTSLPVELGESKTRGQRLGQIDVVSRYKIVTQIDEYYVSRVAAGQSARFALGGKSYAARVLKVYPEITEGTFEVDLVFEGDGPKNIRRGQTLQIEVTLGDSVDALLLPLGGFIQNTGGNWVFVVDSDGRNAVRRDILIGRRNNRYLEVKKGLRVGDRVVTSSYRQMVNKERVQISL